MGKKDEMKNNNLSNILLQRLKALDDGWVDLQKMWETKQNLLSQSLNHLVRNTMFVI